MSHFVKIRTQIYEEPILIECLHDMGFKQVERYEEAQHLFGYQGDQRPETAEVIIRREYVGPVSNDIGFKRQTTGEYQAIISEFDRTHYSNTWLAELNRKYAYNLIHEQAREQNLLIEEEQTLESGDVVIILSERG
jgi:hypothetical protein